MGGRGSSSGNNGGGGGGGSNGGGGGDSGGGTDPINPNDPTHWTWEQLNTYLSSSNDEDEATTIASATSWLKAHQSAEAIRLWMTT